MTSLASGGLVLGLAPTDWLSVEATSDFRYQSWAMGGLALRFNPVRPGADDEGAALDVELGAGLGAGYFSSCFSLSGEGWCGGNDSRWRDVLSYGGYAGTGFGWWFLDWLALYLRARAGFNGSDQEDYMVFAEAKLGVEFRSKKGPSLYLAGGGYLVFKESNMQEPFEGLEIEVGLALPFPVF